MNKVLIDGELGYDPEMSYTPNGTAVTRMSVAVNRNIPAKVEGEKPTTATNWFKIVAWGELAVQCNDTMNKGTHVFIEGELRNRKYTPPDGETKLITEIIASSVEIVHNKEATV